MRIRFIMRDETGLTLVERVVVIITIGVCGAILFPPLTLAREVTAAHDYNLEMSDTDIWTIDTVHLGTRQVEITYDADDKAAAMRPTWSTTDRESEKVGIRNVENSRLHLYQLIQRSDCTQSEIYFEINMPQAYIDEGRLEFVFALQAGAQGDYLFNGRTFTMADFVDSGGRYRKVIVRAADYNEPPEKLRAIERVTFIFERRGSMVSAPVKIRRVAIDLNSERVTPPDEEVRTKNPKSFYEFTYATQADVDGLEARVSAESMDITRRVNDAGDGVALIPQWKEGQIPEGHSGNVVVLQSLSTPHDFDVFEVRYVLNVPKAYFEEGKLDLYLFIQAGEAGYYRWSGTQRPLASFAGKAGQDVVLTITEKDFRNHGKKRNKIEVIGLQLNRNGSNVTEPIMLKRITVKLGEEPTIPLGSTFSWSSDCSSESTFVNSAHPIIPGHYEYVPDPAGKGSAFRGRLTEDLKIDDPESVHIHPEIYFDKFHPGSFTVSFDVWVDDLRPDVLGPYRDKPWLNVVTIFDRTTLTGDSRFEPSVMINLVGVPGAYFLQTYAMSPSEGGTFFDRVSDTPVFATGRWVSVKVDVDVTTARVQTYQDGVLVSEGPYKSRPGLAGAHMGLYTNRLMKQATVYNRSCAIMVRPSPVE